MLLPRSAFVTFFGLATAASIVSNEATIKSESGAGTGYSEYVTETILYTDLQAFPPGVSKESEHLVKQYGVQRITEPKFEWNNENSEQLTTSYPYPHPPNIARHSETTDQKVADFVMQIFKRLQSGSSAHDQNLVPRSYNTESAISNADAKYEASLLHLHSTTNYPKNSTDNTKQLVISTELLPPIELNKYSEAKNVTIFPGVKTHASNIMQNYESITDTMNNAHNESITEGSVQNTQEEINITSEVVPREVQQDISNNEMNVLENNKHNLKLNIKNNNAKHTATLMRSPEKYQGEHSKVLTVSSIRPSDQLYTNAPTTIFPLENVLSANIDLTSDKYLESIKVKSNTQTKVPEVEITELLDNRSQILRCTPLEKKVPVTMIVDSFNEKGPSATKTMHISDREILPIGMKQNSTAVDTDVVAKEEIVLDWTENSNVTSSTSLEKESTFKETKNILNDSSTFEEKYTSSELRHTVTDALESLSKSPNVENIQANLSIIRHMFHELRDTNEQQYNIITASPANSDINDLSTEHPDDISNSSIKVELIIDASPTSELKTYYSDNDKIATITSSPRTIILNEPNLLLIRDLIGENSDVKTPQYYTTTPANSPTDVDSILENSTNHNTANQNMEAKPITDLSPTAESTYIEDDCTENCEPTTPITTSLSETIIQSGEYNQPNQLLIRNLIDKTSNKQFSPVTPENTFLSVERTTAYTDRPSTEYFEFTTPSQDNETETDTQSSSKMMSTNSMNSEDSYPYKGDNSRIQSLSEKMPSGQHIEPSLFLIRDLIDEITDQPYSAATSNNINVESTSVNTDSYTENSDLTLHETTIKPLSINSNYEYSQPDFLTTQNLPIEGYVSINEEFTAGTVNTTSLEYLDVNSNSSFENEREARLSTPTESTTLEGLRNQGDTTAVNYLSDTITDSVGYEHIHSTTIANVNTERYYNVERETNYFNISSGVKSIVESTNSTLLKQTESSELPFTTSSDFVEETTTKNFNKIVPFSEHKPSLIDDIQNVTNVTNTEYSFNKGTYNPPTIAYTINNDNPTEAIAKDSEIKINPILTVDVNAEFNHSTPYNIFNNRKYERPFNVPVSIVYGEEKMSKAHNKPTTESPIKVLDLAAPLNNKAKIKPRPKLAKHIRGNIKYIDTVTPSFHQASISNKENEKKSKILTSESTTMAVAINQVSQISETSKNHELNPALKHDSRRNKNVFKHKSLQNLNISRQRGNRKYYNNKNVVTSISSLNIAKTKNGELSDDLKTSYDQTTLKYTQDLLNAPRQVFLETSFKASEQNIESNLKPNVFHNNLSVEGFNSISTVSNLQHNQNQSSMEPKSSNVEVEEIKRLDTSNETINAKPEISTLSTLTVRSSKNAGFINNNSQKVPSAVRISGQRLNNEKIIQTEDTKFDLTESTALDELVTAESASLETIVMPYLIVNPKMIQRSRLQRSSYISSIDKINPSTTRTMEATLQISNNATATNTSRSVKNITEKYNTKSRNRTRDPVVPILNSDNRVYSHNGQFIYSYESGDGSRAFQSGELKKTDDTHAGEAVKGGFSFMDKEGQQFSVEYTADENGYRPRGAHLPTPPPVPPAIARALAYVAAKSAPAPQPPTANTANTATDADDDLT